MTGLFVTLVWAGVAWGIVRAVPALYRASHPSCVVSIRHFNNIGD